MNWFKTSWRFYALVTVILSPIPAFAQGIGSVTGSTAGGSVLVDRGEVSEIARRSFANHVDQVITQDLHSDEAPAREGGAPIIGRLESLRTETGIVSERFAANLERKLDALQGDGVLTAGEVEDELGELRDQYETELDTVVSAVRDGYPPPPLRQRGQSAYQHLAELTAYTLQVRNSGLDWLLCLIFVLVGAIVAWGVNKSANRIGRALDARNLSGYAAVLRNLSGPLYLALISTAVRFGLNELWIPSLLRDGLHGTVRILLVASLFWFLWSACPGVAAALARLIRANYTQDVDAHSQGIILRVLRVLVIIGLTLVIVRLILNTSVTGILAGLGIVGLALYFVLRGTLQNIAASLTIYSDQPFRVGDMIIYNDEWGFVEDIGFRSTRFRTLDGHLFTIPNSELIDTSVQNAGARPYIRRRFRISLSYDTPPDKVKQAIQIVEDILDNHEGMPEDQPPHVVFDRFGEYDLQLLIQYYYEPPEYWKALEFDTDVNLKILSRFAEAGIDIAYPTATRILHNSDGESAFRVSLQRRKDEPQDADGSAPSG